MSRGAVLDKWDFSRSMKTCGMDHRDWAIWMRECGGDFPLPSYYTNLSMSIEGWVRRISDAKRSKGF